MVPVSFDIEQVEAILHSKGYARYADKTQVVYLIDDDHVTQRGLHVQYVSRLSRELAEKLGLNTHLVEAIALGHDVGHPPFGHEGEEYLSELSKEFGNGPFAHPWQSCRLFREIEPLNLSLEVFDGFLCHDGGLSTPDYVPLPNKGWEEHTQDLAKKKSDPNCNLWPMTLEGCVVKLCDTVSYIARDLEDAVRLQIIDREEVPSTILGNSNFSILEAFKQDVLQRSQGKSFLQVSQNTFDAIKQLRKFNFERIYYYPPLKKESFKVKQAYRIVFESLLKEAEEKGKESVLWKAFLHSKPQKYLKSTPLIQQVVDYIAGMTDQYFMRQLERWVIPSKTLL